MCLGRFAACFTTRYFHRLASFGEVWEEPVLSLVQHSFASLDTLVLQAHQLLLTKMVPEEKVVFSVVS